MVPINFHTVNVNGLGDDLKRQVVLNKLWKSNEDCLFLQETHSTRETEASWRRMWSGQVHFSHGTSNARGAVILIRDKNATLHQMVEEAGRMIIMDITISGKRFTLGNVYAPN